MPRSAVLRSLVDELVVLRDLPGRARRDRSDLILARRGTGLAPDSGDRRRSRGRGRPRIRSGHVDAVDVAVAAAGGYLGLLLDDAHLSLLWAFLLGVGGFCFPTAIALIPARSRSHVITAKLSGFVQPYGYLMAGAGLILVGVAYGATG